MPPKIYVSIPVVLNWGTSVLPVLQSLVGYLSNAGLNIEVDWWIRNSTYNKKMKDYRAIILMTPHNSFKMSWEELPSGTQNEVKTALANSTPVYLCYTPNSINPGKPQFYSVETTSKGLEGLKGTAGEIFYYLKSFEENFLNNVVDIPAGFGKTVVVETKSSTYDRRLLLLK